MFIGTHHGRFHADEVFAVAILKQIYPSAEIIRSRNPEILQTCDIVVDVGGGQYDHHTTQKVYRENRIPYASAGLIWRDFGEQIIQRWSVNHSAHSIVESVDEKLIQGIDADDNGYHLEKDYRIKGISEVIGGFNPQWNVGNDENEAFTAAVSFASKILANQIQSIISQLAAIQIVQEAYERRAQKEILILEIFCPWTETLLSLDKKEEVLFVVFPDKSGGYRLRAVPKSADTFAVRTPLPERWAGKEMAELGTITGIPDAVFCHPARFIAGASSEESIMKMAEMALSECRKKSVNE